MWKNVLIVVLAAGCAHFSLLAFRGQVHPVVEKHDVIVLSSPMGSEPVEPNRQFAEDGNRLLNNKGAW